jgi:hypothetical protein
MTKEEQLPFDEKAMKECRAENTNIEGSSGHVWLRVGTSGIKKEAKRRSG